MFGIKTRERLDALESENFHLRKDLNQVAKELNEFDRQARYRMNKMHLPIVDSEGEEIKGRYNTAQRRSVGIADVIHEIADFVGIKLQYRDAKDGYIRLTELADRE